MVNDETTECLQKLHSTLCQLCYCTDDANGGKFQANIALDAVTPSPGADGGITAELFFMHRHLMDELGTCEWKEAQIRVFMEAYVSHILQRRRRFAADML
jgi:hypothetical protein